MGGCKCTYKNCENTTKTTENVHFFHYPVKNKERCKAWIVNASKPQFCDLEEEQLRNKVICELHFENKWFPNSQKKRLLQGAIPTVDAGCTDEEETEPPMYVSPELQDIQILPANSDGTLFILDTESMFCRSSNKVESYVYKNGMIVPSNQAPKHEFKQITSRARPSTSQFSNNVSDSYTLFSNSIKHEEMIDTSSIKTEQPDYLENQNRFQTQRNGLQSVQENMDLEFEQNDEIHSSEISCRKNLQSPGMIKSLPIKNAVPNPALGRNYLRKIQQHSRDIASIKKMLRQKVSTETKPNTNIILNSMKEQLPPTFFTLLNLNLNNKCELTDEDVDFFTTIHKTSPEVYQLLIDKYRWNLPGVDIVEAVE
ncbi:unnamed protein product [Phaedon cochleariae]|uniref:THAP-type domain-containing protein n=1 Tax=Phaedon cochleariae TaxID=80249 RepID=A0A9P0DKL1_PHACE|nr:unnamed protein product [Phaedon cochleariae]